MGYSISRITRFRFVIGFTILLLLSGLLMAQQETGRITGIVTDPSNSVVPNASVTVHNMATSAERQAKTGKDGAYVIPSLLPGAYTVTVQVTGFQAAKQQITVPVGGIVTADFSLALGSTATTVEVTGEATALLVNTESQTLQNVITTKQILELPTLTRNPYDLVSVAGNSLRWIPGIPEQAVVQAITSTVSVPPAQTFCSTVQITTTPSRPQLDRPYRWIPFRSSVSYPAPSLQNMGAPAAAWLISQPNRAPINSTARRTNLTAFRRSPPMALITTPREFREACLRATSSDFQSVDLRSKTSCFSLTTPSGSGSAALRTSPLWSQLRS